MKIQIIDADIKIAQYSNSAQGNPTNDEAMFNQAAYHVQQAVEKSLKYLLHNIYGMDDTSAKYRTHSIEALLLMVNSYDGTFINSHKNIVEISTQLTGWEAGGRYLESSVAKRDEIEKAISIAIEFRNELYNLYEKSHQTATKIQDKEQNDNKPSLIGALNKKVVEAGSGETESRSPMRDDPTK